MYTSLYSTIKLLVKSGQTGVLKIYGPRALGIISFTKGQVNGIKVGKYSGASAAKILSNWVNFSTNFLTEGKFSESLKAVDTTQFLNQLLKTETILNKIKSVIPDKSFVFVLNHDAWLESSLTEIDQKVTMVIDGKKTVEELATTTGISELSLLKSLYKLNSEGMIFPAKTEESLPAEKIKYILESLKHTLIDITGAVAEIIIERSLKKINFSQKDFTKNHIHKLIENIYIYMEEDEKTILRRWEKDIELTL